MIDRLNNKGFIYIETIITAVILLTALVLLYASYSNAIATERRRLYYDDVAYIYETLTIRDIFKKSVNIDKFNNSVLKSEDCSNTSNKCKYIYFFNIYSPIYNTNDDMIEAREFYNFYQLAYIKLSDIKNIKDCINSGKTTDDICGNTNRFIHSYAYTYLSDYLKSIDVEYDDSCKYQGHEGILIAIYYERKNGTRITDDITDIAFGKYEECLTKEVLDFYGSNYYHNDIWSSGASSDNKKYVMSMYNKNKDLNFDMKCEYAYYISWVYL